MWLIHLTGRSSSRGSSPDSQATDPPSVNPNELKSIGFLHPQERNVAVCLIRDQQKPDKSAPIPEISIAPDDLNCGRPGGPSFFLWGSWVRSAKLHPIRCRKRPAKVPTSSPRNHYTFLASQGRFELTVRGSISLHFV